MWSLSDMAIRAGLAAVLLAFAFGAGWTVNGWRLDRKHQATLMEIRQLANEEKERRDAENAELRMQNQIEADRVRAKYRTARVYVCPDLPTRPDGDADASAAGDHRPDRVDIAPELRACLITLKEVRALQVGEARP